MSDIVERLNNEADRLERRAYGDRCTGPDCALASNLARDAAAEIERLRALLYVETVENAALVARLAGAVEWIRMVAGYALSAECTPSELAIADFLEAHDDHVRQARAFLAKLEGRSGE